MKVRVTFEVNEAQRTGLNILLNKKWTPAPREEIEAWLQQTIEVELDEIESKFERAVNSILEEIES